MLLDLHDYAAKLDAAMQDNASADDRLAAVSALAMQLVHELSYMEERLAELERTAASISG
jgi:hypothetical protein